MVRATKIRVAPSPVSRLALWTRIRVSRRTTTIVGRPTTFFLVGAPKRILGTTQLHDPRTFVRQLEKLMVMVSFAIAQLRSRD